MVKFKVSTLVSDRKPRPDSWGFGQHLVKKTKHKPKKCVTCPCIKAVVMPIKIFFFHEHAGMVCTGNKR